ncbi:MAG: sigma-54 dependent transcriptional regulator [Terriglobales bacterium]
MPPAIRGDSSTREDGPYTIAIIAAEESTIPDLRQYLAPTFKTVLARTELQIQALMLDPELHGIILDLDSIGDGAGDGVEVLGEIRKLREDLILVAITGSTSSDLPLSASQAGADEFFLAPLDFSQLRSVLLGAIERRAFQFEGRRLVDQVENKSAFCGLIGSSGAMRNVYQAIQAVADSNTTVLLRGESGTGKELVAQAIVQCSERRGKPYVCLNCSALPESLIESELFGFEKGAFTGAEGPKPGLIEMAHRGTLFLDEMTTLSHGLQSKLLRALQEHSVQRLGGRSARKIDFRLITATNEDLEDLVRTGRFREDLYYRINVVPIVIPPLRERDGDVPLLVDHFLRIYCAANKKPLKQLQPEVMEILEDYPWPGNVRELENIIQRLVVMNDGLIITANQLPQPLLYSSAASHEAILIPEQGVDFDAEMERIQIAYLSAALRRTGGKKSAAAALLHIDPQRMKYLCRKLRLGGPS